MSRSRPAIALATRCVVETLERRRLLAYVDGAQFSSGGTDQHLNVTFGFPIASYVPASVFELQSLTQDTAVPVHRTATSAGNTVATVKPTAPGPLDSGWYELHVRNGIPEAADYFQTFGFLSGDFDGNHVVNFDDYLTLQNNYNGFGKTYAQGDIDYDGDVDFNDSMAFQNAYGHTLPALPSQAGGVVVANVASGALDVGWTANTDPRDGFKIYRSTNGFDFTLVHTEPDPTARTWRDEGTTADPLVVGTKYWYRVRAYTDANGVSPAVTKAWGVPSVPTPTVLNVFAAGIGPGRVQVKWQPPATGVVVGYRVYRGSDPNFLPSPATFVTAVDAAKPHITDSGLSRGHTYYYRVVAVGLGAGQSLPSAVATAVARDESPGLSNNGTPFAAAYDPGTHDSDGDGTPDALDNDNDNDGIPDEADPDDDNNGVNDNAESDDRDTDGDGVVDDDDSDDDNDGTSDGSDNDDDNDGADDDADASTGDLDLAPSGGGDYEVFNTHTQAGERNFLTDGYTPGYVDFSYATEQENVDPDPYDGITEPTTVEPKRFFGGDDADGSQTFTLSNLPKHSLVSISGSIYGSGIDTPDSPNSPGTVEVKLNGEDADENGTWSLNSDNVVRFEKTVESDDGTFTVEFNGKGFDKDAGGHWFIQAMAANVATPTYTISGGTSGEITENENGDYCEHGSITISRSQVYKEEDLDIEKILDTVSSQLDEPIPSSVHFDKGIDSVTIDFNRIITNESDAEIIALELKKPDSPNSVLLNQWCVLDFVGLGNKSLNSSICDKLVDEASEYSGYGGANDKNDSDQESIKARALKVGGNLGKGEVAEAKALVWKLADNAVLDGVLTCLKNLDKAHTLVYTIEKLKEMKSKVELAQKLLEALSNMVGTSFTQMNEFDGPVFQKPGGDVYAKGYIAYTVDTANKTIDGAVSGTIPNRVTYTGGYPNATSLSTTNGAKFNGTFQVDSSNAPIGTSVMIGVV